MSEHNPGFTNTSLGAPALSCASPAVASAAPGQQTTHHTTQGGTTFNVTTPDFADVSSRKQKPSPLPEASADNISEDRRDGETPDGGDLSGAASGGGKQPDVAPKTPESIEQQEGIMRFEPRSATAALMEHSDKGDVDTPSVAKYLLTELLISTYGKSGEGAEADEAAIEYLVENHSLTPWQAVAITQYVGHKQRVTPKALRALLRSQAGTVDLREELLKALEHAKKLSSPTSSSPTPPFPPQHPLASPNRPQATMLKDMEEWFNSSYVPYKFRTAAAAATQSSSNVAAKIAAAATAQEQEEPTVGPEPLEPRGLPVLDAPRLAARAHVRD